MTKPQFSMTFNLGHLLQIASLIVAMTAGYVMMDARTSSNKEDIGRLVGEISTVKSRVRSNETSSVRNDERLSSILSLLSRIDNRLERIEEK